MSKHHPELAPGSQPQTGSASFVNDAAEQMQSFGNFGLGGDLQFSSEFFNFDAFASEPIPGQFPEPFGAGADQLGFGSDDQSQLPTNGFFFQDFAQLGPYFRVPSSVGAEDVQRQLTSGAELPMEQSQHPTDQKLQDLFQLFPESRFSPYAGANAFQEQLSSDADLLGEHTQHNLQDHELPEPELQFSGDADDIKEQYSSDEETQVHEPSPQRSNNNIIQKFDQHVAEPQVPSAARADQLKNQRSASAASLVNQPQPDIKTVRDQLSNYLQTAGLTEEQKHHFVQTIPEDWMNNFFGVQGMPSSQRRATVPQVPAPVPQQTPAPARQPGGRSRVLAGSSHGAAALPRVPAPSFSDPAPLPRVRPAQAQRPVPLPQVPGLQSQQPAPRRRGPAPPSQGSASYAQFAPKQSHREPSPTPSASSDEGGLNQDTYKPLIYYPEYPYEDDAPPRQYPLYTGHFKTAGQAKRFRKRVRVPPKKNATDIERVKRYGRQYWVRRLYESMIDVSELIDKDGSIHLKRFMHKAAFDAKDLEATAHHIFEQAILVHERGWNRPSMYYKKVVRGKLLDLSATSVESRLSRICELLRLSKAAVDDAIRGGVTLQLVCDNPAARMATKESNNAGNTKRSRSLAYMSSLEAAQGAPLSEQQLAEALVRFAQMEREREQNATT